MSKIILILIAFVVLIIVAFSFVVGFLRRLFGIALRNATTPQAQQKKAVKDTDTVLYHDNTTEVLQGEHKPSQHRKTATIRDASFSAKPTDTSSSQKN